MSATSLRPNNFDLIRLIAAAQVMVHHSINHFHLRGPWRNLYEVIDAIPGVPIFFFVSGFLIVQSYESQSDRRIRNFFRNRTLRIYPGLWVCFGVSLLSVAITGYFGSVALPARGFLAWIFAQTTAFQFYNPEFMRGYGTGVLNGSLWTIPVELQFYLLTPVIVWILIRWWRWAVVLLVAALVAANVLGTIALGTVGDAGPSGALLLKLYGVSFLPWLYMFVTGALFARDERVRLWVVRIPLWAWVLAYASVCGISVLMGQTLGNRLSPVVFAVLASLVFRFAYWNPDLSRRLLGRNDISYGIYIYHMPVINVMIVVGLVGSGFAVIVVVVVTTSLAVFSWRLVERPALRLKATSIRPV